MTITEPHLFSVIMAGGRGTRFWPASRDQLPKQLLPIAGSVPMVRATVDRILALTPPDRILVVTGRSHAEEIRSLLPDLPRDNILVEPVGRNTAPCIGLAAHLVKKRDPHGIMLVLPADHVINKTQDFLQLCRDGARLASTRPILLTLGIAPTHPETGYGYIEAGRPVPPGPAREVISFHEKPDLAQALVYLEQGGYYWNSGMFIWKATVVINWLERLLPDLATSLQLVASHFDQPDFNEVMDQVYPGLESISIDFGVMEKAEGVLVIPADIGWSDVGSWSAAAVFWPDINNNSVKGQALTIDSKGCVVYSPHKTIVLLGVEDLVVVDTQDAILVCTKNRDQDVKQAVEALRRAGLSRLL
jgi:mannose-1-phosphate guanylyltransferase